MNNLRKDEERQSKVSEEILHFIIGLAVVVLTISTGRLLLALMGGVQ